MGKQKDRLKDRKIDKQARVETERETFSQADRLRQRGGQGRTERHKEV